MKKILFLFAILSLSKHELSAQFNQAVTFKKRVTMQDVVVISQAGGHGAGVIAVDNTGALSWSAGGGGGGGTPGGATGNIQFNNSGSFAGDPGLLYNTSFVSCSLTVGTNTGLKGLARLYNVSGNLCTISYQSGASNCDFIIPNGTGMNGNVLTTDGAGHLSWTTPGGGGGSPWITDGGGIHYGSPMGNVGIGNNANLAYKLDVMDFGLEVCQISASVQQMGDISNNQNGYGITMNSGGLQIGNNFGASNKFISIANSGTITLRSGSTSLIGVQGEIYPSSTKSISLGDTTHFFQNTYTDTLFTNAIRLEKISVHKTLASGASDTVYTQATGGMLNPVFQSAGYIMSENFLTTPLTVKVNYIDPFFTIYTEDIAISSVSAAFTHYSLFKYIPTIAFANIYYVVTNPNAGSVTYDIEITSFRVNQ